MDVIGQYFPTKDQVQIRFMPNKTLVNKMLGSLNPNGRDLVIDGCDSIRRRVRSEVPGVAKKNLKELTDAGALDVMIDVLKLWMEDAPVSGRCDLGVLRCCGAFTLLCDSCPSHDDVGGAACQRDSGRVDGVSTRQRRCDAIVVIPRESTWSSGRRRRDATSDRVERPRCSAQEFQEAIK